MVAAAAHAHRLSLTLEHVRRALDDGYPPVHQIVHDAGTDLGTAIRESGRINRLLQPVIYLQTSSVYTLPVYVASLILAFMYAQWYVVDSITVTGLR